MTKPLYQLNPRERELIDLALAGNPDPFTDFYLRGPNTGTWWLPGAKRPLWKRGYAKLHKYWLGHDRPVRFEYDDKTFIVRADHEKSREFPDHPAFHHNHGFKMLPYGKDFFQDRTPVSVVVGGKGCIAPNTRIYDVEQSKWVEAAILAEQNRAPLVAAWTGSEFVPIRASIPFIKGIDKLYEVVMRSGRRVTTTLKHVFLTESGWQPLADLQIGARLLGSVESHPLSNQELSQQDTPNWDEIVEIRYANTGEFYDLHVPVWNNYLAEGLVHHNSGKTLNVIVVPQLIWAAVYEDFRGFALAPEATQANEVLRLAWQILQGTLYLERFVLNYTRGPNASMRVGNDLVGETSIECYPLLKREDKLLTLTGDTAAVDQAEKFDNPRKILQDVGTRFRGRVIATGRPRIGKLALVANADYNDELFRLYDMQETEPEHYKGITVSSYDNIHLTERDLENYEVFAGDDEDAIDIHLRGKRPLGNGKEFSRDVMERMRDPSLDEEMAQGLQFQRPGYSRMELHGAGVVEWMLPYAENHHYLVVSDPGTGKPPERNAYGIMVWDITGFPGTREIPIPAKLAGFIWGDGRGDIKTWANRHAELTWKYRALGRNAFDATGYQAGYDEWMMILNNLMSEKINLSGNSKALCLNAAKMLTSSGYIRMPRDLPGLYNQLQRYDFQQDKTTPKLKQDLVMTFIMSAWWLQRLWYVVIGPETTTIEGSNYYEDRYERFLETRESAPHL